MERARTSWSVSSDRARSNLERLAEALSELSAELRGALPSVSFRLDAETLEAGRSFTFETRDGNLDVFGEPAGAPPYQELKRRASVELIEGLEIRVASLDHPIAMKQAAGRTKDTLRSPDLAQVERHAGDRRARQTWPLQARPGSDPGRGHFGEGGVPPR
jgi:hypothetical protein